MCKFVLQVLREGRDLYFEHDAVELREGSAFSVFQTDAMVAGLVCTKPYFPESTDLTVRTKNGWLLLLPKTLLDEIHDSLHIVGKFQYNPEPDKVVNLVEDVGETLESLLLCACLSPVT